MSRASFPRATGNSNHVLLDIPPHTVVGRGRWRGARIRSRHCSSFQVVAEQIDFDPVDEIGVGTIGPAGQRQFFLRATHAGRSVVLFCEKFHVQGLIGRIQQLLASQGRELESGSEGDPAPAEASAPEWTIGELGLGFHESKGRFVIVAREAPAGGDEGGDEAEGGGDSEPAEDLSTARFWVDEAQVRTFVSQATAVLSAGRPTCPRCGLPMDPSGHPCPASNGSRPVF
jgi:uncharacterized repeat protein (TIGR03847 family)